MKVLAALAFLAVLCGTGLICYNWGAYNATYEGAAAAIAERDHCDDRTRLQIESAASEWRATVASRDAEILRLKGDAAHDSAYYERALRLAREQ